MTVIRDNHLQSSLGGSLISTIKKARVLLVGAGGIGCELLKNLVLTGFGEVEIVDLDTIDLSNLNRQFLFRREHIKKPKALVAKEAAGKFNPDVQLIAHHANIKESSFSVEWFRRFDIVFNALDNLDARRHVNKMCLVADVPLIESGTTGFNGQCQVIKKGVTACYDCSPKETPKSFPVCTIRSTPSQPIHCIVWAKSYLLNEIFGVGEDEAAYDHSRDKDDASEIAELQREAAALAKIRANIGSESFYQMLFDKVFDADINRLRSMEDMWKTRKPPEALTYLDLSSRVSTDFGRSETILQNGQRVWTLEENLVVFIDSLRRLSNRILDRRQTKGVSAADPTIAFDKDDIDTLDFVAASANIRAELFGIERKSRFEIKQMAGNIIPAIATTNAIVAGLCVLQSFHILRGDVSKTKEIFLSPFASSTSSRLLASDRSRPPNPDCPICSVYQTGAMIDLSRATLNDLVEGFLRLELGYGDKEIIVNNELGLLYDADETDNLSRKLSELGIKQNSMLTIIDEDEESPCVNVVINVYEVTNPTEGTPIKGLDCSERTEIPRKEKKKASEKASEIGEETAELPTAHSPGDLGRVVEKRKRLPTDLDEKVRDLKRAKTAEDTDDDVVLVDGSAGVIVIVDD